MAVPRRALLAAGVVGGASAARRLTRFEIAEESMAPALLPGDYVLAVRRPRRIRPGDVVIFEHPEQEGFTLVKRVVDTSNGLVETRGENRLASRDVGPIAPQDVEARVALIYWPPGRFGRVATERRADLR